jgi:hypothetical protein
MVGAFGSIFIFICIVISILEKEYQPIDWLASEIVSRSCFRQPGGIQKIEQ